MLEILRKCSLNFRGQNVYNQASYPRRLETSTTALQKPKSHRDSVGGIVTRQSTYCGSILGKGKRFFASPKHPNQLWDSPRLLFNGSWGIFPWKWSSWHYQADHSPPSSAQVKNNGSCTSTSLYDFITHTGTLPHDKEFVFPLWLPQYNLP
jgi:hypothetical protein